MIQRESRNHFRSYSLVSSIRYHRASMSEDTGQKWIVKMESGQIRGPYSTKRVLQKINQGLFTGEELISKYPGTKWMSISQDPIFYDRLLQVLSGDIPDDDSVPLNIRPSSKEAKQKSASRPAKSSKSVDEEHTRQDPDVESIDVEKTTTARFYDDEIEVESPQYQQREPDETIRISRNRSSQRQSYEEETNPAIEDIELTNVKSKIKQQILKNSKLPFILVIVVIVLAFAFLLMPSKKSGDRLRLKAPNFGKTLEAWSNEVAAKKTKEAVSNYLLDTYDGYVLAQSQMIDLIERDPKNLNLYGLLCLTYYELWPFAYQDSKDLKVIEHIAIKASAINPTHLYTYTCRTLNMIAKGQISEAKAITAEVLDNYNGSGPAPIPFYYFKAVLLSESDDFITAQGYANSAHQLWPQWLRAYILEAEILMDMGNNSDAYKILARIYEKNKNHPMSKVLIGIIEYIQFSNVEKAKSFLNSGLKKANQMPADIAARGYLTLAQIAISENDQGDALDAAKKTYSLDPSNETAKTIIRQLGGEKELERTEVKAHQLILEGDQFVREGDCQSAQAHYKSAFEMDDRLAIAAFKAGRCLWRLSFSIEAIEWLKKAIKSDSKLIDAYILLADYYSARYDFVAAARTLGAAQAANPKSHEVLRGYAMVELRRNNPRAAISYAKQALMIYGADVDSMILSAKAYLQLREDVQTGYSMAAKAVEMDPSNREAQIIYARALAAIQGVDYGVNYLQELITTYPLVSEYRLALGRLYFDDERYNDAEAVFRQLIEIENKPKEALIELGKVLRYQNDIEKALEALFRAAVYDPADAEPFFLAGMMLLDVNKPHEAKQQFERVLIINKSYPLVRYQIGRAELLLKNPKGALEQSKEEKKVNPNLAAAYSLAAEAYSDLKQFDLCAQEYQKAIKLRPQGADIYVRVAGCYRKGGNFDSAHSMLNIASKIESGNPDIYKEQGALFESKGDLPKAIQAYKQYFVLDPNAPDRMLIEKRIRNMGGSTGDL